MNQCRTSAEYSLSVGKELASNAFNPLVLIGICTAFAGWILSLFCIGHKKMYFREQFNAGREILKG